MLNQSGITITVAGTPKQILWAPENAIGIPCMIGDSGISAGSDGRKIVPAGTPLTGDLTNRTSAFTKSSTGVVGIALHDVDVTSGNRNATVLVAGVVDLNKVDSTTAALITTEVKAMIPNIIFVK